MSDGTKIIPATNIVESAYEPPFGLMPRVELEAMAVAGDEVLDVRARLAKTSDNVVGELIKGEETFYEWNHYPDGDVYDGETGGQFFYHAHPADIRIGEHGHFHTFLRPDGMTAAMAPAPLPDFEMPEDPDDALSHIIGISMDKYGDPICLFTTNRWVTGEVWYAADDVVAMLDLFEIGHTQPSWPVNRWISAMLRLYKPQIAQLIRERDVTVGGWQPAAKEDGKEESIFEDRDLEVTSYKTISLESQIGAISEALEGKL